MVASFSRSSINLMSDNNEDADHLFMMFSATFPKDARVLAKEYMAEDFIRIRVGRAGSTHANVSQNVRVTHFIARIALHTLIPLLGCLR